LFVEVGDVLFNATNSPDLVGKSAHIGSLSEPTTFSNHFIRLRTNSEKLEGSYLARWLHTQFQSGRFKGLCRQWVNQATVSRESLLCLEIPLPPLPEQRRIAAILDQADALRAKHREALAQLDILTQSIFVEMFGEPTANTKKWPVMGLKEVISLQGGFAFKSSNYVSEGIPLIRIGEVNRGGASLSNACFLPKEFAKTYSRFLLQPGDLLMSLTGTTGKDDYGNVVILGDEFEEYLLNQRVAHLKPDTNRICCEYLFHLLRVDKVKEAIISKSRGVRQANISNGDILELNLPVPNIEIQNKFSQVVSELDSLKKRHQSSLMEFDTLFMSLQHRAFRGEL
jgi:type I restriction enzyme S subunit